MKASIFFLILVIFPLTACAQDENKSTIPLEKFYVEREKNPKSFLKNFHFGLSIGGGNSFFSHQVQDFGVYQVNGQAVLFAKSPTSAYQVVPPSLLPNNLNQTVRFSNWITDAVENKTNLYSGISNGGYGIIEKFTTSPITFKSNALNIPLKVTVHYEFKQFRFGAGYSYEFMSLGTFHGNSATESNVFQVKPTSSSGFMSKYFGIVGYSFYRWDDYLFTVDANVGNFNLGSNFNAGLIQKSLYYNLGLTIEKDFSEYLKAFIRPSIEIKSYSLSLPSSSSISHSVNAVYLNIGFTYSIPELPKCYNKDCHAQINHAHGNKEYRSRVHKIWEKQNPGYGENDPVLIKYKGKNKRKLDPY